VTSDPQDLIGRSVGRYTLDRLLGQGGFAWVFAGRDSADGRPVAVKVLKPRYAGDDQFEYRFRNESAVASELDHPNVIRISDVGQQDGFTFFAMDLYPESLATRLEREGTLSEEDLVSKLSIDALLPLPKITEKLIEELNLLEPFGAGNPEPVFATTGLKLMDSWIVGNDHLKLKIKEKGRVYSAIGFRMADRYPLPSTKVDLAFVPQFNEWEGVRSIQLKVKDVRTARSASS